MADGGEQGGAQPVGLGEGFDRGGLLGEPLLAQRDGGLGGECLDEAPVGGGEDASAGGEGEHVVDGDVDFALGGSQAGLVADRGGESPDCWIVTWCAGWGVGAAFKQADPGEAEGLLELVEQGG